jgi:DNA-binding response OmpR family regulator
MSPAGTQVKSALPLLVVSVDDLDHSSLHRILGKDCHLHQAVGRRDAVSMARHIQPWVVICDQILADGDWRDLLMDLQTESEVPPPLIVSSRLADDRLWAEVLNLGGYDLLTKPFLASEVSRVVKMAARRGIKAAGK